MITILSPAKSLDFTSKPATRVFTQPRLVAESSHLIDALRQLSVSEVAGLMRISDELAALNVQRYADFTTPFTRQNARQAILAFDGDVYQGLDAPATFATRDYTEAQKTVRILSGLYGVLRPLDLMQPYRLEMGIRLRTQRGPSLYAYWGDIPTRLLAEDVAASPGSRVVVNLASEEYSSVVRPRELGVPLVSPRFLDTDARGRRSIVSFYAKRARGAMAAWIVRERIHSRAKLAGFTGLGYRFDAAASTVDAPAFVRSFEDRPLPASA
ncbi:peroxide stress protein YaaA [Propioniciclava flava]